MDIIITIIIVLYNVCFFCYHYWYITKKSCIHVMIRTSLSYCYIISDTVIMTIDFIIVVHISAVIAMARVTSAAVRGMNSIAFIAALRYPCCQFCERGFRLLARCFPKCCLQVLTHVWKITSFIKGYVVYEIHCTSMDYDASWTHFKAFMWMREITITPEAPA